MFFMLGSKPASTITFKPSQAGIMLCAVYREVHSLVADRVLVTGFF